MKTTFQYRFYPDTKQKLELNEWLRISRYWYNRQLGDRFDWWLMNRTRVDACPLVSSIADLRDKPNFYAQKKQLPILKQDLVKVWHSGELLDFSGVDASVLQEVSKRVDKAMNRFIMGDSNGNKSGKPRFKTVADFRTLTFAEGEKLPSLKPLRKNQAKLDRISTRRNKRIRGSKARRKLAKREAKQHQRIARSRKDFQYKTAHKLVKTGKKVFFHEDLNLKGLTKRNKAKQADDGIFLPNGQSAKSGLNKSWLDAAFGNFFKTLDYIAAKAGAVVIPQKPAYSSMVLCYRDEIIFTDCSIRNYWDEQHSLKVDRDINAAINLKRLGLDIFPSIKRRSGKLVVVGTMAQSTTKEILHTLHRAVGSLPCNL